MIGYLFAGQDPERLVERELEWTARALGVEIEYQGRPLAQAHRNHPIRRGHFHRRNQILLESIQQLELPTEVYHWWGAHSAALERVILGHASEDVRCERTADEFVAEQKSGIRKPATPQVWVSEPLSTWGDHVAIKSNSSQGD